MDMMDAFPTYYGIDCGCIHVLPCITSFFALHVDYCNCANYPLFLSCFDRFYHYHLD